MLRQLARLARPVPAAGPRALAIAVYADSADGAVRAQQAGNEGVACVDDAARALELYCDLWRATGLAWARRWCEGLLDFILAMQTDDGLWVNFILDWDGTPNRDGRTSVAGGAFWQARALLALARVARVLSDARIDSALNRGLEHIVAATVVPSDVRALHIMTALTLHDGTPHHELDDHLGAWCDEVMRCRQGDVLMNSAQERGAPHLWGHVQEGVLALAGTRRHRPDLVEAARRSAALVFAVVVEQGFNLPRTQPYDVASTIYSLSCLAEVTGEPEYAALAAAARAWFDGRNPSGRPVYDRTAGRVGDGVDGGRINVRSGAEANIVAAHALFDDATTLAWRLSDAEALPPPVGPDGDR